MASIESIEGDIDTLRVELNSLNVLRTDDFRAGFEIVKRDVSRIVSAMYAVADQKLGNEMDGSYVAGKGSAYQSVENLPELIIRRMEMMLKQKENELKKALDSPERQIDLLAQEP